MVDCKDIDGSIKNDKTKFEASIENIKDPDVLNLMKKPKYDQLRFLLLLVKWHSECMEKIEEKERDVFPKEQEKKLIGEINDQVHRLKSNLAIIVPEYLKNIRIALYDYEVGGNIDFNKLLIESLHSSIVTASSKIIDDLKLARTNIERYNKRRLYLDTLQNWAKYIDQLKTDDEIKLDLDSQIEPFTESYLLFRRDIHSLYLIYYSIEAFMSFKNKEVGLRLQTLLSTIGEFFKKSSSTGNLSNDVFTDLKNKGVPIEKFIKLRDSLEHQIFPIPNVPNEMLLDLHQNLLHPLQNIIKEEIINHETKFIGNYISSVDESDLKEKIKNFKTIPHLIDLIDNQKKQDVSSQLTINDAKLLDKLYEISQRLKFKKNIPDSKNLIFSLEDFNKLATTELERVEDIRRINAYEEIFKTLMLHLKPGNNKVILEDILKRAQSDLMKIAKVLHYLRYADDISGAHDLNDLFQAEIFIDKQYNNVLLKDELSKYYDGVFNGSNKEKFIWLLEKNPPALKKMYDSIIKNKNVDRAFAEILKEYKPAGKIDANEMQNPVFNMPDFYFSRLPDEIRSLKDTNNINAIEAQMINLYNLIEFSGIDVKIKSLRNYLHHKDILSDEDIEKYKKDLPLLKEKFFELLGDYENSLNLRDIIDEAINNVGSYKSEFTDLVKILCGKPEARRKRASDEACLTWDDITEFNEGDADRDLDHIEINSDKFINVILKVFNRNKKKFSNYIALARESDVNGEYKSQVELLTNKHNYATYLDKVERVSNMIVHGMIAKDILGDLIRGDYTDVAINLGFLGGSVGLEKIAEAASKKGAEYLLMDRAVLGNSLKLASPFLSRAVSAFIAYDLYNQVKAWKSGNKDALIGVIGDSIQLGVDATALGIEATESLGLGLVGVSAITNPIGLTLVAVTMVGTQIYSAVRMVDKIDAKIHLTRWEKFVQGVDSFFGQNPSTYLTDLMEKKDTNNEMVERAMTYLQNSTLALRYVGPAATKGVNSNKIVHLNENISNIKVDRAWPDEKPGLSYFCLPEGDGETIEISNNYYCNGAIGVEYKEHDRSNNYTVIDLGKGNEIITGFQTSGNIFVLNEGHKEISGGEEDDNFIIQNNVPTAKFDSEINGIIDGRGGINTIDVRNLAPRYSDSKGLGKYQIFADFRAGSLKNSFGINMNITNFNQFLGRKDGVDNVISACNTKHLNGYGGENSQFSDQIEFPKDETCSYNTTVVVNPHTKVINNASNGNFIYYIQGAKGTKAYIDLTHSSLNKNEFRFSNTLLDVAGITSLKDSVTFKMIDSFHEDQNHNDVNSFELIITGDYKNNDTVYNLSDNTQITLGRKDLSAIHTTTKPINSIIRDYALIAEFLQMFIVVNSNNNEILTIGHTNRDVLTNDPHAKVSHLVSSGLENIFRITSGVENLNQDLLPISEVIIYEFKQRNEIDTIDLQEIKHVLKSNIDTKLTKLDNDLIINLFMSDEPNKEIIKITLKYAFENEWYKRINIAMDDIYIIKENESNFELVSKLLIFNDNRTIYVINVKDIQVLKTIIVRKNIRNYTFTRHMDNLIITNSLNLKNDKDKITFILNNYFDGINKNIFKDLTIQFDDKTLLLSSMLTEIEAAKNFDEVKAHLQSETYQAEVNIIKEQMLFKAIKRGDLNKVKDLVSQGVDYENAINDGRHPLHYAAELGQLDIVEYLVDHLLANGKSIDVVAKSYMYWTPLHFASWKGHSDITEYLKKRGANPNAVDIYGRKPLVVAATFSQFDVLWLFLENGTNIDNSIGVESQARAQSDFIPSFTLLHWAAFAGFESVAKFLIEKGADINSKDEFGRKPVHIAVLYNNLDILALLIQKGVSINEPGEHEQTPLHYAIKAGNAIITEFLLKNGADINSQDSSHNKPIHVAAMANHLNIVDTLLTYGAGVDDANKDSWTPLFFASYAGNSDMVKFFIEKGGNIHHSDSNGKRPIQIADMRNNNDIVALFLEKIPIAKGITEKDQLPEVTQTIIFSPHVCIKTYYDDFAYVGKNFDDKNRLVYVWPQNDHRVPLGDIAKWSIEPRYDFFFLKNIYYNQYLYVSANNTNYHRDVFIWIPGGIDENETNEFKWNFECYDNGVCKIKNLQFNEYLMFQKLVYSDDRKEKQIFTLSSSNKHLQSRFRDQLRWKIENCTDSYNSHVIKKRDLSAVSSGITTLISQEKNQASKDAHKFPRVKVEKQAIYKSKSKSHGSLDHYVMDKNKNDLNKHVQPNNDFQMNSCTSATLSKPRSWIGSLFSWVDNSAGSLSSDGISWTDSQKSNEGSISQVSSQVDINGTILLADLLLRNLTGQKSISTVENHVPNFNVQSCVLDILDVFQKIVNRAASKSKVSIHRLNIDFMRIEKEVYNKIMNEKFNEIPEILRNQVEKVCPSREPGNPGILSRKKFERFMIEFDKQLNDLEKTFGLKAKNVISS